MADIKREVCQEFGVTKAELTGNSRVARIAHARSIAIGLAREFTRASLPVIGRSFNRDHSTIYNALGRSAQLLRRYPDYRTKREAVIRQLTL